jgi:hypothetical protein
MPSSRAESGPDRRGAGRPAADSGAFMAAPLAEAFDEQGSLAEASVRAGGCFARPLPLDPTCAGAARSLFREAVAGLGLPGDLVHDGVTMASELAANTLHAHGNVEFSGGSQRPVSGFPELWVYLRGAGARCEIVCKIFDSQPGWKTGNLPDVKVRTFEGVNGRGLQVVDGLSAGEWGAHLTRGRLGSWKVSGKAVWFALRLPPSSGVARFGRPQFSPCHIGAVSQPRPDRVVPIGHRIVAGGGRELPAGTASRCGGRGGADCLGLRRAARGCCRKPRVPRVVGPSCRPRAAGPVLQAPCCRSRAVDHGGPATLSPHPP